MNSRNIRFLLGALGLIASLAIAALSGCASTNVPSGFRPTATTAQIVVAVDQTAHTTHTPIGVTLANTGTAVYYGLDGRSGCTLIQLQRLDTDSGHWVSVDGCSPTQTARVLEIPALVTEPFTLPPGSSSDPNAWQPGLYRVATAYSPNPDGISGESAAYSAGFRISG